jgi:hypothetical protein
MANLNIQIFQARSTKRHYLKLNLGLLLTVVGLVLFSCGKSSVNPSSVKTTDTTNQPGAVTPGSGIYIAGYETTTNDIGQIIRVAKIWKNGIATALTDGTNDAAANSVFVTSTDVYAAGYKSNGNIDIATVWKNGKATALSANYSRITSMYVFGEDVYLVGWENVRQGNSGSQFARIWKNGMVSTLPTPNHVAYANSVYVTANQVYVAGSDTAGAKLWINVGAGTYLTATNGSSGVANQQATVGANSVYVTTTGVYVAGQVNNTGANFGYGGAAEVWKDGMGTALTSNDSDAAANAVYVNNRDVYVAGYEQGKSGDGNYTAKYWKNGIATTLSNYESTAYAISGSANDIYVLGDDSRGFNPGVNGIITLWKNGVSAAITNGTNDAHGASLFIK